MTPQGPQGPAELQQQGPIVGYCRACGKALDEHTVHRAYGTIYCEEHVPAQGMTPEPPSPYTSPAPPPIPDSSASPPLAFLLGLIPGVGAIYNGQYAKGLVHVLILGLLFSIAGNSSGASEPLITFIVIGFWAYMAFEAYHTAKQRKLGHVADDVSSLVPGRGSRLPAIPVILIVLGVIFLLNNLGLLDLGRILRYWPVLLIAAGIYMLYVRFGISREGPRETGR